MRLAFDGGVRRDGVLVDDTHVEAERAPSHGAPDSPEPHDSEGLAVDVRAPEEVPLPAVPLARACEAVGLHDAPGGGHQEGPREIRRRLGKDVRCIGDDHAAAASRRDVDVVVADRDIGDHFHGGRRREDLVVDRADDVADEAVLAPETRHQLGLGERSLGAVVVDGNLSWDEAQGLVGQNV